MNDGKDDPGHYYTNEINKAGKAEDRFGKALWKMLMTAVLLWVIAYMAFRCYIAHYANKDASQVTS